MDRELLDVGETAVSRPAGEVWIITLLPECGGGELVLLTLGRSSERSWRTRCVALFNTTELGPEAGEEGDYPIGNVGWERVL